MGINENDLFNDIKAIVGDLNLSAFRITKLRALQRIGGNADFRASDVKNLGKLKSIGGNARLFRCKLKEKDFDNIIVENGVQDDDAQSSKIEESKPPQQLEQPQSVCIEKHTLGSKIISLFKSVF